MALPTQHPHASTPQLKRTQRSPASGGALGALFGLVCGAAGGGVAALVVAFLGSLGSMYLEDVSLGEALSWFAFVGFFGFIVGATIGASIGLVLGLILGLLRFEHIAPWFVAALCAGVPLQVLAFGALDGEPNAAMAVVPAAVLFGIVGYLAGRAFEWMMASGDVEPAG